nr:hypothetical protein [Tanacetum cinerariifolium]
MANLSEDIHCAGFDTRLPMLDRTDFALWQQMPGSKGGYEWAFASLIVQDVQTFTGTMLLNFDQLERQLDKEEFKEDRSMAAFWFSGYRSNALESENSNSEHAFNKSVNESSGKDPGKQDTSSSSENYVTHTVDADIRPTNDQVPFAE